MRFLHLCTGVFILALAAPAPGVLASEASNPLCTLVQHEERLDLEQMELVVGRAESRLAAAEQIFALVEALWKDELIERIAYLGYKHDRDVAVIDVKRQGLVLRRQEALLDIYENFCASGDKESEAERAARLEAAQRKYQQADCHRIGKNLAIAETNLAFHDEWLASVVDLRVNGVATAQEVILAEENVEVASREVRYHAPRLQACREP